MPELKMTEDYPQTFNSYQRAAKVQRAKIDAANKARKKKEQLRAEEFRVTPRDTVDHRGNGIDHDIQRMSGLQRQSRPAPSKRGAWARNQERPRGTAAQRLARHQQVLRTTQSGKYKVEKRIPHTGGMPDSENLSNLMKAGRERSHRQPKTTNLPPVLLPGDGLGGTTSATAAFNSGMKNARDGNYLQAGVDMVVAGGKMGLAGAGDNPRAGKLSDGLDDLSMAKDIYNTVNAFRQGHTCDGVDGVSNLVISGIGSIPLPGMEAVSDGGAAVDLAMDQLGGDKYLQDSLMSPQSAASSAIDDRQAVAANLLRGRSPAQIKAAFALDKRLPAEAIIYLKNHIMENCNDLQVCEEDFAQLQAIREGLKEAR